MNTAIALLLMGIFATQNVNKASSLEGKWISRDDKKSVLTISKKTFCESYNGDESCESYSRSTKSCDTLYTKLENLDFIALSDGRCFEITALTNSSLVYRHTSSGRLHSFYKGK